MDSPLGQIVACLALACTCCNEPRGALFDEVSREAGIDVALTCGDDAASKQTILEVNGNGLALVDLDGDGDLDVVLVDGSTRSAWLANEPVSHPVLINQGPRDGIPRFRRAVHDTGLTMGGWPTGIAAGDIDGDGREDLVIGGLGEDVLFLNRTGQDGAVRFERRALPGRASPLDWTTSVALADADGDGVLDIYLARYLLVDPADPPLGAVGDLPCRYKGIPVMCGPQGLPAQADVLLRGLDGRGHFEDVTAAAGLAQLTPSYGLGVLFMDIDQDGHPDLYVANDSVDNFVLRNRGDGTFESRGSLSGAVSDLSGAPQAGMGVDAGDVDRDGDFDLVVTNFSDETNALYRNDGAWLFRDVTSAAGIGSPSRPLLGWGVHLDDFDGDGWLDVFFANGHVYPEMDREGTGTSYAQPLMLLPGTGPARFGANVFPDPTPLRARAAARGDLDGDGDSDLIVLTLNGAPRLYVNRSDAPDRHLLVTLADGRSHVFGATLRLRGEAGWCVRQTLSACGFQSRSDPRLHVTGTESWQAAEVLWPGGEREPLDPGTLTPGRHVVIERGRGVVSSTPLGVRP